jgi:CheY-like chemotaxis protein
MSLPATILLVDDSRASRMLCSSVMQEPASRPCQLLEAGDAAAALAVLEAPRPDLAVLDMNMPGMSGLELAERLRVSHPDMKLALLTANVQEAIQRRAAALGVRFFRKPIGEAVIADILAFAG